MTESLSYYFRELKKCKILDKEEINRLIVKAQAGDNRARDKIIMSNLRFVVTIAKSFEIKGMPLEDLISSGNEGLLHAITKFNPNKGASFISYASYWIKQAMYTLIYYNRDSIRLPLTQRVMANKIAKATNECIKKNGYIPSSTELSQITGIDIEDIDYLAKFNNRIKSLDEHIGGEDTYSQLQDVIPSDYNLESEINYKLIEELIVKSAKFISSREKDILSLLFGVHNLTLTLQEVANLYGVTKERIRQIRDEALRKIRTRYKHLENDLLDQ